MADRPAVGGHRPRVAVTRSVDDNRRLVDAVERLGFDVVAVPLMEVAAPGDAGRALASALADLGDYRWVVLTSVNGVRSVAATRAGSPWPHEVAVAVVGPSTAASARSAGIPVALMPDEATAAALVDAFPPADPGAQGRDRRVLAPLAELAGPTVEVGLRALGWEVDRVVAYRTSAPDRPRSPDPGPVDVVAFFSPSAVDRWADRFGPGRAQAVCIGPSTAQRARGRGFEPVVEADPHTEDGVLAALEDVLGP